MSRSRQNASSSSCASRRMTQPVGLQGELTKIDRVPGTDRSDDLRDRELPAVRGLALPHDVHFGARDPVRDLDVRPVRTDDQRPIAARDRHLRRDRHPHHRGPRHADAVRVDVEPVQAVEILLDGVAQGRQAAGVGVERLPVVQGLLGGFANERRSDRVALAEPQGNDRGIVQPLERDTGDAVLLQGLDDGPHHGAETPLMGVTPVVPARVPAARWSPGPDPGRP